MVAGMQSTKAFLTFCCQYCYMREHSPWLPKKHVWFTAVLLCPTNITPYNIFSWGAAKENEALQMSHMPLPLSSSYSCNPWLFWDKVWCLTRQFRHQATMVGFECSVHSHWARMFSLCTQAQLQCSHCVITLTLSASTVHSGWPWVIPLYTQAVYSGWP